MRRFTNFFLILGLLVITHGFTRWDTFRKFATPIYGGDGDPRFLAATQQLIVEIGIGLVLVSLAAYFWAHVNKDLNQPTKIATATGGDSFIQPANPRKSNG